MTFHYSSDGFPLIGEYPCDPPRATIFVVKEAWHEYRRIPGTRFMVLWASRQRDDSVFSELMRVERLNEEDMK